MAIDTEIDTALFAQVESAIRTVLHTKPGQITQESALLGDLGAESLDFLDISCEIERLVDVELDFKEVFRARRLEKGEAITDLTVGDLVAFLQSRTR